MAASHGSGVKKMGGQEETGETFYETWMNRIDKNKKAKENLTRRRGESWNNPSRG